MKSSYRFYRGCYRVVRAILGVCYSFDVHGKENIPDGAAMVCANHSHLLDPIVMAFAFGIDIQLHIIAKAELFKIPVLSAIVQKLGAIRVDRSISDIKAIKETLSYLSKGKKVVIFPEGTRSQAEDAVVAKNGAVKLAEQAKVPIVPLFIPRKKPLFSRISITIGEPYYIEKQAIKRKPEEYSLLADALMAKINALNRPQACLLPRSLE